jgi:hypothetical protein
MILRKWNFETKKYEPFDSPATKVSLYSEDMSEEIDCTNCGRRMTYGDGLTSRTIHTAIGLGFPVCQECYDVEFKNEEAAK